MRQPQPLRGALVGAVAGLVGAYAKSLAEPPLQRLTEQFFPPTPQQKEMIGADPIGHQDRMPPAEMIEAAGEALGHEPTKDQKLQGQQVIHYALGALLGATYGTLAETTPQVTVGAGVPAGAVMYGLTHATAVPATGFQAWPWQLPVAAVLWESGSHLVFGLTTELTRLALNELLDRIEDAR